MVTGRPAALVPVSVKCASSQRSMSRPWIPVEVRERLDHTAQPCAVLPQPVNRNVHLDVALCAVRRRIGDLLRRPLHDEVELVRRPDQAGCARISMHAITIVDLVWVIHGG